MQINRLFEMVYLLLDKKNITAGELAAHFEVSLRTVYRDIETLSQAGIPIYAVKGKGGGIRLTENFILNKAVLTDEEQKKILQSLYGVNAVRKEEAEPVLSRLSSLFGGEVQDWIEVEFSTWDRNYSVNVKFEQLKEAIFSHQTVTFDYSGANGRTGIRRVNPLKLVFRASGWYLYAWCSDRQDFRYFKLCRMEELQVTEETFERSCLPAPSRHTEKDYKDTPERPTVTVTAVISRQLSHRVLEEFDRETAVKQEDGSWLVQISMSDDDWLVQYLLSFGCHLKVLSPPYMIKRLREELEKTLKMY